jgi:hypothetical protein
MGDKINGESASYLIPALKSIHGKDLIDIVNYKEFLTKKYKLYISNSCISQTEKGFLTL